MTNAPQVADHENFGGYEPVRKLGEGGTSLVFEGRRASGDFTRRVAIKVVLDNVPANLSDAETHNLARLEHPNIARLLTAGATPAGLRFLVMEFVDGVPCTVFANERKLDEAGRLKMFLQICDAVQYANRSLVIHCDLKPANVLVTGDGTVKLLDFGISRLLSDVSSTDPQTRMRYYSVDYASPEQILGRPMTVAADVYSLGALLCEVLGGRPPRSLGNLPLAEIAKAIQEELKDLPLTGDLEQIARKALQPDPSLRYATAGDLAADVKRYLSGRPIEARPPSRGYRLRTFVGRYRVALGAAAAVIVALAVLTGIALRQRRRAVEHFDQVRKLANSVLFEFHDAIEKLPGSLEARHVLVNRSVEYLDALARSAGGDHGLQLEAAKGYIRLADIEGTGNEPSLGQSSQALPRLQQAEQIVRAVLAKDPGNFAARRASYQALEALAAIYSFRADPQSVPTAEELLRVAQENLRIRPQESIVREEEAHALAMVADAYTYSRTHGERGIDAWQTAVAAWKKLYDEDPSSMVRKRELARSYQYLAGAQSRAVKREEARATILVAYQMHKELAQAGDDGIDHMLSTDVGLLANLSAQLKRYAEAVPMFQEQLRLREKQLAEDPNNLNALMGVGGTLDRIGFALVLMNKPAEGIPYIERGLEKQKIVHARDPENMLSNREMLYAYADLTDAYGVLKQRERMCQNAAAALKIINGPFSRTRETPTDASKKALVRKALSGCGG